MITYVKQTTMTKQGDTHDISLEETIHYQEVLVIIKSQSSSNKHILLIIRTVEIPFH